MFEQLHKKDIVNRVSEKLSDERHVVGGHKYLYKKKYHLRITKEIISKVISAFWEVIAEAIADGDTVNIVGYMTIEPKYKKGKSGGWLGTEYEGYYVKVTKGKTLKNASKALTEKMLNQKKEEVE